MEPVSYEPEVATERRLLAVLARASVVHLGDVWSFVQCGRRTPEGALAVIRHADGWCALVPADTATHRSFCVSSITFSVDPDNRGFVGWLASAIRRELDTGVLVVCGDNPLRGGIFDYWAYPPERSDEVRLLIDRMQSSRPEPTSLDLRLFRVTATSPGSAISSETAFQFRERAGRIEASYRGGQIVAGSLMGVRDQGHQIRVAYSQLHEDGQLNTGTSTLSIERRGANGLRLVEDYTWSTGGQGRNVLESVDP